MSAPSPETTTPAGTPAARPAEGDLDTALHVFLAQRNRLFRIAYRIVGDAAGAEDVVQEAWVRWQLTDRAEVKNPVAFLTTTTTRLAINVIQSGRRRTRRRPNRVSPTSVTSPRPTTRCSAPSGPRRSSRPWPSSWPG
ncbi:sigma factor [Streptomyces violaceoruber]